MGKSLLRPFPERKSCSSYRLAVSFFQLAVWVEAKLPRPVPPSPNAHSWRTATLAVDTERFHDAFLRKRKRGFAGVLEVVCAADESFTRFSRVDDD